MKRSQSAINRGRTMSRSRYNQFLMSYNQTQSTLELLKDTKDRIEQEQVKLLQYNSIRNKLLLEKEKLTERIQSVLSEIQSIKRRHESIYNDSVSLEHELHKNMRCKYFTSIQKSTKEIQELDTFNQKARSKREELKLAISQQKTRILKMRRAVRHHSSSLEIFSDSVKRLVKPT